MAPELQRLNLGCGDVFLPGWHNLDFVARPPHVVRHDLRETLPLPAGSCEVVYHSHVLEHFDRAEAGRFLAECHRVLAPGGVLRVVVPDLEQKARLYLDLVAAAAAKPDDSALAGQHQWMTLEMLDQLARRKAGGEMAPFMRSGQCGEWVRARIGDEFDKAAANPEARPQPAAPGLRRKVRDWLDGRARRRLGLDRSEVDEARFRQTGEMHRWMYDRISLSTLLAAIGFTDVTVVQADVSRIRDWSGNGRHLDIGPAGLRRPDSLFIEALRP
ncbi:MAG: methyltransferase domain-containing protein [Opitutaceae bacterium]|nr:methyltransferase domain-containing protein [Opitutaceae bacterium]